MARSVRPAMLPADIVADLASERVVLRLEAVRALSETLLSGKVGMRDAAVLALRRLQQNDDSVRVRDAAAVVLTDRPPAPAVAPSRPQAAAPTPAASPPRIPTQAAHQPVATLSGVAPQSLQSRPAPRRTNLLWAWISVICFYLGIPAVVYAYMSLVAYKRGDVDAGQHAFKISRRWSNAGFILFGVATIAGLVVNIVQAVKQ